MTDAPLVVIQARMGSSRLPGKVLMEVAGRPLLAFMLDRLAPLRAQGWPVVVATSSLARDAPVIEAATAAGADAVAGDEQDVLSRFVTGLDRSPAELVVRLTADCPLVDPAIVTEVVNVAEATGADYTSNTLVRTYPDGLDVEVIRADALRTAAAEATDAAEREHVTPFLYRRPRRFLLAQLTTPLAAGAERWTVDTAEDLDVIKDAVARFDDPSTVPWTTVLEVLGRHAHPLAVPGPAVRHERGQPYERRWSIDADGHRLGTATVVVDDGVGRLTIDVTDRRADADAAVRHWLTQDLQTTTLIDDQGATP